MQNERESSATLSEAGRERQERMHQQLLAEMLHLRRTRRRRRHAVIATLILLLVGSVWITLLPTPHSTPTSPDQLVQSPPEQPLPEESVMTTPVRVEFVDASPTSRIKRIQTDPSIVHRYLADDVSLRFVTYLSDEQLVRELAAIGEPAGVVRLPDRVLLVRMDREDVRRWPYR